MAGFSDTESFAFALSRLQWDVFGTLTFCGREKTRPHVAYGHAWRHIRYACRLTGSRYTRLLVALRGERGELGGRFHFHYLLGGLLNVTNVTTLCYRLERAWTRQTGARSVSVRPYDHALAGASYILKCLGGANAYELSKFGSAETEVTLSASCVRVVRAQAAMGMETRPTTVKRLGGGESPSDLGRSDQMEAFPVAVSSSPAVADPVQWVKGGDGCFHPQTP